MAGTSPVGASYRQATAGDMSSVGAFALTAGSADSAMVLTLPIGAYTVQVAGQNSASGVALAEVYELDPTTPEVLGNISSRDFVGTGSQVAIPGSWSAETSRPSSWSGESAPAWAHSGSRAPSRSPQSGSLTQRAP